MNITTGKEWMDEVKDWSDEVKEDIQKSVEIPEVKPCEECGRDPLPWGLNSGVNDCKTCGNGKPYDKDAWKTISLPPPYEFWYGSDVADPSLTSTGTSTDSTGITIISTPTGKNPFYDQCVTEFKKEKSDTFPLNPLETPVKPKVCECGAESVYGKNAGGHSRYCDFFGDKL